MFASYEYAWPFVKCTYRTCSMLLKILPLALYTSPLSVQALQGRSCLCFVSYATTAAKLLERSSKVKVTLRLTVSQSVSVDVEPHLRLMNRYLLLFDNYGLVL
jgi:hypothetical protein